MFLPLPAIHIPDGFLSIPVSILGLVLTAVLLALAYRMMRRSDSGRSAAQIGIVAALVFAAQMMNFHIGGGTSGHLIGGAIAAILLGPWTAVFAMTSVVAVQAIVFQDGGMLALGFNVFNMGIVDVFIGYAAYRLIASATGNSLRGRLAGAAVGSWLGVEAAALATALQLAVSGTSPVGVAVPAMTGVHALIGIGEAIISVGALAFTLKAFPARLLSTSRGYAYVAAGLALALAIVCLSPLASPNPDGLERVAEDQGFIALAQAPSFLLLPDYTVPFVADEALTTIFAGMLGVLAVAGIGMAGGRAARREQPA